MSRNGRRKVPSSLAPFPSQKCLGPLNRWHFGGENPWLNWKLTNTNWSWCSHNSSHLPFWSCWRDPCPLTLVCGAKGSEVGWPHPKKDSLRITIFSARHEEFHCFTILFSQFGWNDFGKCGAWHCPTSNKGLHVCCQNAARKETRYRSEGGKTHFIGVTSNKVWKSVRKKSSGTVFDECCLCKTTCQLQVSSLKISSVFFAIISLFAVGTFSCGSAFNPWLLLRPCFSWTLHQAAAVLKLQATNLVQPERWCQMSGVPKSS